MYVCFVYVFVMFKNSQHFLYSPYVKADTDICSPTLDTYTMSHQFRKCWAQQIVRTAVFEQERQKKKKRKETVWRKCGFPSAALAHVACRIQGTLPLVVFPVQNYFWNMTSWHVWVWDMQQGSQARVRPGTTSAHAVWFSQLTNNLF